MNFEREATSKEKVAMQHYLVVSFEFGSVMMTHLQF